MNNIAFNNVQESKAALDVANDKLIQAKKDVASARNNVQLSTQANDDAITNLNIADSALTEAQRVLLQANKNLAALRE